MKSTKKPALLRSVQTAATALLLVFATAITADDGSASCTDELDTGSCSVAASSSGVASAPPSSLPHGSVGNPINLMSGNKFQREVDFALPGATLEFNRLFNSANADSNVGLGQGWHHSYAVSLFDGGNGSREIVQSNGSRIRFTPDGADDNGQLLMRGSAPNYGYVVQTETHHEWHLPDSRTLVFQGSYLVRIDWPDQRRLEMFYRGNRLHSVTDETGRVLRLDYHAGVSRLTGFEEQRFGTQAGHLKSVTLPDGSVIEYDYDNNRNLTRVRYPDNTSREYHYESDIYPNHLTGITDRTGVRIVSWRYDEHGRAVSSEYAGGVKKVTLQLPELQRVEKGEVVQTVVTNSLGAESVFTWQQPVGASTPQLLSSQGPGCSTCPATGMEYTYDTRGLLLSSIDTKTGRQVRYEYDEQRRILAIYEQVQGSVEQQLVRNTYLDKNSGRVSEVAQRSVNPDAQHITRLFYNDDLLPIRIEEHGFAPVNNQATEFKELVRRTDLIYENRRLVGIDGPREDVDDITEFSYDALGRLSEIRPAAGPVMQNGDFDALGRPRSLRIGSQSPYRLAYDEAGRITSVSKNAQSIFFAYDGEGRMVSLTDPYGRRTRVSYDDAGRAIQLIDDAGQVTQWSRDSESRLSGLKEFGLGDVEIRSLTRLYDTDNYLIAMTREGLNATTGNMAAQQVEFERDELGHLSAAIDVAGGHATLLERDEQGRVISVTSPDGSRTGFGFDAKGQAITLTDARGNITRRVRDDFGRVVFESHPDTGQVANEYDAANNRTLRVSADGTSIRYSWDAGNRLLSETTGEHQTIYAYDEEGRLTEATNGDTREQFGYNLEGQLIEHTRTIDEYQFTTQYDYDDVGRAIRKRLPDGQSLRYHYHDSGPNHGQLRAITREALFGFTQETLIAEIDLDARDGAMGYLAHNGLRTDYRFAPNGVVQSIEVGQALQLAYRYDDAGRIIGIDNNQTLESFQYSENRLVSASTRRGDFEYRYDAVGNRVSETAVSSGAMSDAKHYRYPEEGGGNRLLETIDSITGAQEQRQYNSAGSLITQSSVPDTNGVQAGESVTRRFEYNHQQRPTAVYDNGQLLARYRYNAFGERIAKVVHTSTGAPRVTYFLHDGHRLTAEIKGDGSIAAQYVYLADERAVLKLRGKQVLAIHGDHLGTPLMMSDQSAEVVWDAQYDPYGAATLLVEQESLDLRLPGQVYDAETGTHYNRYRDYDPHTGRYQTSDPIGLEGGVNTYAYAEGLPNLLTDVLGLDTTSANNPLPGVEKPTADFESKLSYVLDHVKHRLTTQGAVTVADKFFDDVKAAATILAGIAGVVGVGLGAAAATGVGLPVALGALASAASAVGVAALWATGFEGVKFLYDIISITVGIYGTPHTNCLGLRQSADALFDEITDVGSAVVGNVVGFGIGKIAEKLSDVFKKPNVHGRCSFDGDTLVLSRNGYTPIRDIEAGRDQVWARSEHTGEAGWKGVLAQYSNTYEETVHTRVRDKSGKEHTLSSNRIHPFFARVAAGVLLTVAAEGHVYAGDIDDGAWVDAQHLQVGDELLGSDNEWQEVVSTQVQVAELQAYNLTVDGYSTYYVAGDESAAGVWVHNVCFDNKPDYFSERAPETEFGHRVWKDPESGEEVYRAWDQETGSYRYYKRTDHPPSQQWEKVNNADSNADAMADRLGGESRVKFPGRWEDKEFDFYTKDYIGETKQGKVSIGSAWRKQAKHVFEAAIELDRTPYFHFEVPPDANVINKLQEYAIRYGIEPVVDISPI